MSAPEGTIYVVDDDEAVRDSLEALLSSEGFETAPCSSAEEFLRHFDPPGAACVLLDVRMPGMDGLTMLERLGGDRKGVPVVILTGHADVPMAVRAIRAGAADFVEKPFAATPAPREHPRRDRAQDAERRSRPTPPSGQGSPS